MVYFMSQLFCLFAILFWAFSIQYKEKKDVLMFQICASLLYAVQFYLLKGYAAFVIDVLACFRLYIYYRDEKNKGYIEKRWLFLILLLTLILGFLTYDGYFSLIPIFISVFYAISTWVKNTKVLRIFYIICAVLWTFYNFKYFALIGVIGNVIEIVSGIISMIRFDRKKVSCGKNKKIAENN